MGQRDFKAVVSRRGYVRIDAGEMLFRELAGGTLDYFYEDGTRLETWAPSDKEVIVWWIAGPHTEWRLLAVGTKSDADALRAAVNARGGSNGPATEWDGEAVAAMFPEILR